MEILVVDDGSQDQTAQIATRYGARAIVLASHEGAARAKNRGAASARGQVLLFLDSDVVCRPDALVQVSNRLSDTSIAGLAGVLDLGIPFSDFATRYKNAWMTFTYLRRTQLSRSGQGVGLFYTSAAAIRRQVFMELGGFDEHYSGASIAEDTEFGQRAWAAGHKLVIEPALAVLHLKRYTPTELLTTDLARAHALTLLRLRKWRQPFYTSVPLFFQLGVVVLSLGLTSLLAGAALALPGLGWLGLALLGAYYFLNAPWHSWLARRFGLRFLGQSILFAPLDSLAVALGMLSALFAFARGQRY